MAARERDGACGTGYPRHRLHPVSSLGTIYVTWNNSTGENCAVTIRNKRGAAVQTYVSLNVVVGHESTPVVGSHAYPTYAGPVCSGP